MNRLLIVLATLLSPIALAGGFSSMSQSTAIEHDRSEVEQTLFRSGAESTAKGSLTTGHDITKEVFASSDSGIARNDDLIPNCSVGYKKVRKGSYYSRELKCSFKCGGGSQECGTRCETEWVTKPYYTDYPYLIKK